MSMKQNLKRTSISAIAAVLSMLRKSARRTCNSKAFSDCLATWFKRPFESKASRIFFFFGHALNEGFGAFWSSAASREVLRVGCSGDDDVSSDAAASAASASSSSARRRRSASDIVRGGSAADAMRKSSAASRCGWRSATGLQGESAGVAAEVSIASSRACAISQEESCLST